MILKEIKYLDNRQCRCQNIRWWDILSGYGLFFYVTHKKASVSGVHFCVHGNATHLFVISVISRMSCELIHDLQLDWGCAFLQGKYNDGEDVCHLG